MSGKRSLFDDNSDEDDGDVGLSINKDYAQRYEEWREAEIKKKLEDKYGNAEESMSSSSSDDDDDPEELKQVLSKDFFEVISSLKTKDPKIYNQEVEFFKNEKQRGGLDPLEKMRKRKEEKEKPIFLRDYERKLITEKGGKLSDEESDDEEAKKRAESPSLVEEQRQLKESLRKALQDDNSDEEDGLLKKKEKSKEQKEKEEEDYIEWLKGERKELPDKETEKSLKPLQNLWNDPKLEEGEKFLRDYILNKRYLENGGDSDAGNVTDEDYQEEYMNEFERKYNFRYEEPDREFLKRYPRTMEQSLRQKDTRRKEKRDAVKQRKEEEKQKKREELKVLKALKRKEILKKIEKIKSITGNDELGLNPEELEEDFDPEAHDRKMRELFSDDYYQGADEDENEDGLNLPPLEEELLDDDITNWDDWDGTDRDVNAGHEEDNVKVGDEGPFCEDPDFNMDCEYDPVAESKRREEKTAGRQSAREKRKLKRQSRFGRLVRKEKPVFDPNDKTFQEYVDEYYAMDYEDLIGDIPCRFKYKSVAPNSFGLTIEEILAADDKELNEWASLKKTYAIRSDNVEKYEAKVYAQKAQNEELKRKILPSLYKNETDSSIKPEEIKKKNKKKKNKIQNLGEEEAPNEEGNMTFNDIGSPDQVLEVVKDVSDMKKKKKSKHSEKEDKNSQEQSDKDSKEQADEISTEKKKKKKKKLSIVECEENDQVLSKSFITSENGDWSKKKKCKKLDEESSVVTKHIDAHNNQGTSQDMSLGLKNKEKKRKMSDIQENIESVSKKPRKKLDQESRSKKFKKLNRNKEKRKGSQQEEISDARLKAYGIHPKHYKNKLKYGSKN